MTFFVRDNDEVEEYEMKLESGFGTALSQLLFCFTTYNCNSECVSKSEYDKVKSMARLDEMPDGTARYFIDDWEGFDSTYGPIHIKEKVYHPLAMMMLSLQDKPTVEKLRELFEYEKSEDLMPLDQLVNMYRSELRSLSIETDEEMDKNVARIATLSQKLVSINTYNSFKYHNEDSKRAYLRATYAKAMEAITFVPVVSEDDSKEEQHVLSLGDMVSDGNFQVN